MEGRTGRSDSPRRAGQPASQELGAQKRQRSTAISEGASSAKRQRAASAVEGSTGSAEQPAKQTSAWQEYKVAYVDCSAYGDREEPIMEAIGDAAEVGSDAICVAMRSRWFGREGETPLSIHSDLKLHDRSFRVEQTGVVACMWNTDVLKLARRECIDEQGGMPALAVTLHSKVAQPACDMLHLIVCSLRSDVARWTRRTAIIEYVRRGTAVLNATPASDAGTWIVIGGVLTLPGMMVEDLMMKN